MPRHLPDEIIQIILNELDDPTAFSQLSKRYHHFTKDPYVRSSYFLTRYGRIQAIFWALGRGKLVNERVLDILLSSGAHLSRYLVQCAIHHYFRAQVSFIKTKWVRTLPLPVFNYFLTLATATFGDFPHGKNEDDGSIFTALLKCSRFPTDIRSGKLDTLQEVLEKYKFIPFSNKDPLMAQFPLVLAIQPCLLPYARANGFRMDRKYRNFVFRKMFEKPAVPFDGRVGEIIQNVKDLTRLDTDMFLSRTVAAEICMEARTNEPAYTALKRLDKEGLLKFELLSVVEDLTKLFVNTRSISNTFTNHVLSTLYRDFTSQDPTVRLVLLCTVFFSEVPLLPTSLSITSASSGPLNNYVTTCREKIEGLGLAPITRQDLFEVLVNRFAPDRFGGILEYGRRVVGLDKTEISALLRDVAFACLEVGCKGKMLKKLFEADETLSDVVAAHVLRNFQLSVDDLPSPDDEKACRKFEARLCRDVTRPLGVPLGIPGGHAEQLPAAAHSAVGEANVEDAMHEDQEHGDQEDGGAEEHEGDEEDDMIGSTDTANEDSGEDLGPIGQDTLSTMIRKDELAPSRRRRFYDMYSSYNDTMGKLPYPVDYMIVSRFIRIHYGRRSAVAAVFMLHAVLNGSVAVMQPYSYNEPYDANARMPVTLKYFKMLARIGRAPTPSLFEDIETGTEFYFSEEDYLTQEELAGVVSSPARARCRRTKIKMEVTAKPEVVVIPLPPVPGPSRIQGHTRGKKRPRRSATTTMKSYVVPDSDDEEIAEEKVDDSVKKRRSETNLQRWIKHLTILHKEEQKKYKEKRKLEQAATEPGIKIRSPKSDFFKALTTNLARLRKADREKRKALYGPDVASDDYSEGEEDEYQYRTTRSKRRKVKD
ncbi:hypothetical protein POSPLADRAFT_1075353 [Postia placenta MAD-698-R-SB12]|uniref:Uncharacterized protein n=1 Tax=Postia placenta MAD-698-R-SB12 TaxID=670580 RepID=A0A1X6MU45_9APHY|nr:hypothetical protein POSPLADRAFT_1075353 [Postia placenta MAD-698-R-SB12]OSX59849.1 hypothetical protein POSPLADRAFT_1075353 [Postia placenta MAD-698-R-SB12]